MKIRKAIIPAAGLGTRFLPITAAIPKEMLPIIDTPCLQFIVEEAIQSGITEIILITHDNKQSIEHYFKNYPNKKIKFHFVRQPHPHGDGHAILCAAHLVKDEPFAVLFGDDIYDHSGAPALLQLIKQFNRLKTPIVGLTKVSLKETHKYGIIRATKKGSIYKVTGMVEKPHPSVAPSRLAIVGKYIVTPELLKTLSTLKPNKNHELRLIHAMQNYLR
ncbi:MAG: sugar phosphate nucleotidyltransferase, partial [Candidatus Gracilibacteria bacterium]